MGRGCSRPIGPSRRRRRGDPVYHSNSRSASPGVGAHKPFTPGASGHGIPNENLRLDGGACARSGPREGKKRKKPPPQVGDRQANLTVCATRVNPTAMGGGCLVSLPLAPLKRGWPTRVGSPNAASVPFSSCWNEETSECGGSGGRTTGLDRPNGLPSTRAWGELVGALAPPAGPGRAINALLGKRHHEVEKRAHRCSGEAHGDGVCWR